MDHIQCLFRLSKQVMMFCYLDINITGPVVIFADSGQILGQSPVMINKAFFLQALCGFDIAQSVEEPSSPCK